nr:nuclear transport factor 2 family protein [Allomuricauda sp.]
MIQRFCFVLCLLGTLSSYCQANTEVYLFDLDMDTKGAPLSNPKNISNNHGYDNQPSFWDDNTVLFSSTREGQTDILRFNINQGSTSSWVTNTPTGSEYSPVRIPGKDNISAIRLDLDGLQRLYEYDIHSGESEPISDLKIGYHVWYNDHILVSTVLVADRMDLAVIDLDTGSHHIVHKNVGRSLHKVPGTDLVSFISKGSSKKELWQIKSLDVTDDKIDTILTLVNPVEDMVWLPNGALLIPNDNRISLYNPKVGDTKDFQFFDKEQVFKISRLAVNPSGTRLALVTEISPKEIVQRQVDTFNKRDLDGFVSCYTDDVLAQRFPNDTMYVGKAKMLANYERFYANTKNAKVEVIKRITIENKVIDEEITMVDGRQGHQVALYTIEGGLITSMTFIFPNQETADAESVVQEQLDAYNARDIDGFSDTYADHITLHNFPNQVTGKGKNAIKERYGTFFKNTPNLHCKIKNRMVIGNKVIDEEQVTVNDSVVHAVAIYEVENGKIVKVTFLR